MGLIPSQEVKDNSSTPIIGMKAKARKKISAGRTRMSSRDLAPGAAAPAGGSAAGLVPACVTCETAVMSLPDGCVHRGRELLGAALEQEQQVDVRQECLGLARAECL